MAENQDNKRLYIVSREAVVEAGILTKIDEDAAVLLVGRGLLLPEGLFNERNSKCKRAIYAIAEEVQEQGLSDILADCVIRISATEAVDLILQHKVLNFG